MNAHRQHRLQRVRAATALFAEPGLFPARSGGTLYRVPVQTMPYAWRSFADVLQAAAFVTKNDYPARGEAWLRSTASTTRRTRDAGGGCDSWARAVPRTNSTPRR